MPLYYTLLVFFHVSKLLTSLQEKNYDSISIMYCKKCYHNTKIGGNYCSCVDTDLVLTYTECCVNLHLFSVK